MVYTSVQQTRASVAPNRGLLCRTTTVGRHGKLEGVAVTPDHVQKRVDVDPAVRVEGQSQGFRPVPQHKA